MLHLDHITFAMLLAKISLKGMTRYEATTTGYRYRIFNG